MSESKEYRVSDTVAKLSDSAKEKLDDDGSSNSEFNSSAFSLALSWVNAGGTVEEYVSEVSANMLGQTYQKSDLERRLRRTYADAEEAADQYIGSGSTVREQLAEVDRQLVLSDLPTGLKASARALVQIGLEVGTWKVDASARRIAEITGSAVKTAAQHMHQFVDTGLVTRVRYNGHGRSRTFDINTGFVAGGEKVGTNYTHIFLQVSMCVIPPHFWSKHGLGPIAGKVFNGISVSPSKVADVTKRTGSDRKTVRKYLGILTGHGLVVRLEAKQPRYVVNLLADVDTVADSLGIAESIKQQREKHAGDRDDYQHGTTWPWNVFRSQLLEHNPWTTEIFDLDQREFRLNADGLEAVRNREPDLNPFQPPERFKEYRV